MQTWEYYTTIFEANTEVSPVPLHDDIPIEHYPVHTPLSLIPQLNRLGEKGWELVSFQPVISGKKGDVLTPDSTGGRWATNYLCAFKRARG